MSVCVESPLHSANLLLNSFLQLKRNDHVEVPSILFRESWKCVKYVVLVELTIAQSNTPPLAIDPIL